MRFINQDINPHLLKEDYVTARNIRNGVGSELGVVVPSMGNELVEYSLPANATCIGAFENRLNNEVIYFIKGDQDRICRLKDDSIETLIFGDLGFDQRVHSCVFVKDLCYFTDGKNGVGNPPRKFNISKASRNKTLTYQLDIPSTFNGGLVNLIIKNTAGVTQSTNPLLVIAPSTPRGTIIADLTSALSGYSITLTSTEDSFAIASDVNTRIIELQCDGLFFYPLNHYPLNFDLSLIKPVPVSPIPTYVIEDNENNKLFGFSFQFRYRYIFDDNEKSAWGQASYTPTNFIYTTVTENSKDYSRINLTFSDARMNTDRHFIRAVEIGFRTNEDGTWKYIDRYSIDKCDVIPFYNDKAYPAIASDEASDTDTQALKNFDFCPEIAMGCDVVYDEFGNPIMVWGGCVEGKDLITIDADIEESAPISPLPGGDQTSIDKTFKAGGLYRVVAILEDAYGRQASAIPLGRYSVPFNRLVTKRSPRIFFNSIPPIWATRYKIAMTKNRNQAIWFQAPAWELRYWKINKSEDTATSTTYAAGDASYVGLAFNPTEEIAGSLRNQFFYSQTPDKIFTPIVGDRIQFLDWFISGGSNPGNANIKDYNFEIAGYNLTTVTGTSTIDKFTIFIEFNSNFPNFSELDAAATDYILCEVYRQSNTVSDEVFYEVGPTYDILDPGTESRSFQSASLENYGDAVSVAQRFDNSFTAGGPYFVTPNVERNTLHEFSQDVFTDFGRVCVEDPDGARRYEINKIRATGLYNEINGLSAFKGSDYVRVSIQNGNIQKMAFVDGVLLAIGQFKTQPIYVSRGRVIDVSGNTLIGRSSNLFSIADELRYDLGTHNPESVLVNEGACYGFDVYRGTVWRYVAGAGQDVITQGLVNFFQDFGKHAWQTGSEVICGFQREFNTYYLRGTADFGSFTLGYVEGGGWVSFYTFYPEAFASLDQRMVSFYEGALWMHEEGNIADYYGLTQNPQIQIAHSEEGAEFSPVEIQIIADKRWDVPLVNMPIDGYHTAGQVSKIPDLKNFNGTWKGSFLRDQNDTSFPSGERLRRGRKLWGTVLLVTLETDIFSRLLTVKINATQRK